MKRLPQLDGVRGVAILLVLAWHYLQVPIIAEPGTIMSSLKAALSLAWSGVDLFFVLSGFLIAGNLFDSRDASNYFRVFYFRRACRIFPLYYLLLLLFICLPLCGVFQGDQYRWMFQQPMPLWSYASFTQNIFMGLRDNFGATWLAVTWSLAIEEQFYLIMPLLIYFLPRHRVFHLFIIAAAGAVLLRFYLPGFQLQAYVNSPWRADSLLLGACLAILTRSSRFMTMMESHKPLLAIIFGELILGAVVMIYRRPAFGPFDHLWLAGLYAVFILVALVHAESFLGRILRARMLVWCGTLSYGIYLLHPIVNGVVHGYFRGGEPAIRSLFDAGITGLALLITLALASISYRYLELPFLTMGRRTHYAGLQPQ